MHTTNACPKCSREGRLLEHSSSEAFSYYRCDPCGQVWVVDNARPHLPARDVNKPPADRYKKFLGR